MEKIVSRLLEQEQAVRLVLSSDRKVIHLIPTWQDIQVWEFITKALSPIADLTDFLSGDTHVTISSVIPVLHNLGSRVLSQEDDNTPLTNDLKTRYSDPKVKDILNIATFLDPRFKADYVNGVYLEMIEDMILDQGIEFIDHEQHESQEHQQEAQEPEPPLPKKKKLLTFLKKDQTDGTASSSYSPGQKLKREIETYKLSPKLEVESEETSLQWWKTHHCAYPTLSRMAKKHLCICATSCASERLFSTSGNIVSPHRASLKPHKVNMLVFLSLIHI